jgi:ribosomal protein S18 acetylase RimI-like enzyme
VLLVESESQLKDGLRVALRSPKPGDAASMLTFLRTLFHESWRNLNAPPDQFDSMAELDEAALLKRFADASSDFLFSAFLGERVVGNLGVNVLPGGLCAHTAQLGMGVLREAQGRGLGEALLRRALDEAAQAGVWNVRLTVRVDNAPAVGLYEKVGFRRVGLLEKVAEVEGRFLDEWLYQRLASPLAGAADL